MSSSAAELASYKQKNMIALITAMMQLWLVQVPTMSLLEALVSALNKEPLQPMTVIGNINAFYVLHAFGGDIHFVSSSNQFTGTIIIQAIKKKIGRPVIEELMRYGADFDCVTPSGYSPLLEAIYYARPEATLMLDYGADPRVRSHYNRQNALHMAILHDRQPIVDRLLGELSVAKHNLDHGVSTTVWWCSSAEELLAYINSADRSNNIPVLMAAKNTAIVERLMDLGADTKTAAEVKHSSTARLNGGRRAAD